MGTKFTQSKAQHMEYPDQSEQKQLVLQGEALEALEKTYGIWQSMKENRFSLLYSMLLCGFYLEGFTKDNIVLAAYSCAAVYVRIIKC